MRLIVSGVLMPAVVVMLESGAQCAENVQVTFELNEPEIVSQTEVRISGTTNLPVHTEVLIRADLTARNEQLDVKGHRLSVEPRWGPVGTAVVAADGTFAATLREPHRFKTGNYRVAAQVWVFSASVFGASRPQPAAFYQMAGPRGGNLRGPNVDRSDKMFLVHVAVSECQEFELCPGEADEIAGEEKQTLLRYSRALDDEYVLHEQLRRQGVYARWSNAGDFQANRIVVDYGHRLRKSHTLIRPIQTQEAFFLLTEALNALDQVHYWSWYTAHPEPAKYAEVTEEYAAAKQRLDDFIDSIE